MDDEPRLTVLCAGRCMGLRLHETSAAKTTFGSFGSFGIRAAWPQDELRLGGGCVRHGHVSAHQPGDRRGEYELPGSVHDRPVGPGLGGWLPQPEALERGATVTACGRAGFGLDGILDGALRRHRAGGSGFGRFEASLLGGAHCAGDFLVVWTDSAGSRWIRRLVGSGARWVRARCNARALRSGGHFGGRQQAPETAGGSRRWLRWAGPLRWERKSSLRARRALVAGGLARRDRGTTWQQGAAESNRVVTRADSGG